MRAKSRMLLGLTMAALLVVGMAGAAHSQAVPGGPVCDPDRPTDNPVCAFGARCVRIAEDCGIWSIFCTGGADLHDACKLFCRDTSGRCELQGAACAADGDCGGRGSCRQGRCVAVQAVVAPPASCGRGSPCPQGQSCFEGSCARSCKSGVSDPCPDGEGCLGGRCVPL